MFSLINLDCVLKEAETSVLSWCRTLLENLRNVF